MAVSERDEGGRRAWREHLSGVAPRNWGKNVTLNFSISLVGTGLSLSIEGPADGEAFGLYLRELLCPALARGQIVVMDNLSVRKSAGGGADRGARRRGPVLARLLAGP